MDRIFTVVTIYTFFFTVSAARISLDSKPSDLPLVHTNCGLKALPESTAEDSISNLVVLPTERYKSDGDDDRVQKSDNDRLFRVDLTPRSDFARFHAINRRFSDQRLRFDHHRTHRRFENPFVMPRSEISNKNEAIVGKSKTGGSDARNLHRRGPATRLKVNHDYGHHHRHQHHHIHHNINNNDVSMRKHKFASEKVKSLVHQHMEKTREHEASFMKSIRKFLKHTFD